MEEEHPCKEKEKIIVQETVVGTVSPEIDKKILCETVPPDRTKEMDIRRLRKSHQIVMLKGV